MYIHEMKDELQKAIPQLTDKKLEMLYQYFVMRHNYEGWMSEEKNEDDIRFNEFCKKIFEPSDEATIFVPSLQSVSH